MRRVGLIGLVLVALVAGSLIGWMDTRPTWDDTGITVGMIVIACLLLGAARPHRAWVWALLVGGWVPALNILFHHNYGSVAALAFAFAGAYVGAYGRWLLGRTGAA
ncbi:MAG: hypothetical protein H0X37_20360 [Herpetosiphonaceae bacterium]|nr:hypothetical protein [Herpetosiphonaceae bacterium]